MTYAVPWQDISAGPKLDAVELPLVTWAHSTELVTARMPLAGRQVIADVELAFICSCHADAAENVSAACRVVLWSLTLWQTEGTHVVWWDTALDLLLHRFMARQHTWMPPAPMGMTVSTNPARR